MIVEEISINIHKVLVDVQHSAAEAKETARSSGGIAQIANALKVMSAKFKYS